MVLDCFCVAVVWEVMGGDVVAHFAEIDGRGTTVAEDEQYALNHPYST